MRGGAAALVAAAALLATCARHAAAASVVHEMTADSLEELEDAKIAFMKLDPSHGCCQTELDDLWAMFATHVPQKVWRINCEKLSRVCHRVLGGRENKRADQPLFVAWKDGSYNVYQGEKGPKSLIKWLQVHAGVGPGAAAAGVPGAGGGMPPPMQAPSGVRAAHGAAHGGPHEPRRGGSASMRGPPPSTVVLPGVISVDEYHRSLGAALEAGTVDLQSNNGSLLAALVGRYYVHHNQFETARKYYNMAARVSAAALPAAGDAEGAAPIDDCGALQAATMLTPYPTSLADRDRDLATYMERVDDILGSVRALSVAQAIATAPLGDAYALCIQSPFYHSYFYAAGSAERLAKHYEVTTRAFPELKYTAPHLIGPCTGRGPKPRECLRRREGARVRLGVASAFFMPKSSVWCDFGGMLTRLPRERFEIVWLGFDENSDRALAFIESVAARDPASGEREEIRFFRKADNEPYPNWLHAARNAIESLRLDVLLFLDLSMSPMIHRVAMARLARVQATTHGHPTTSGFPPSVMDYFVSWAAAEDFERPGSDPRAHYTEHLALLPAHQLHQYYEPRATPDGRSAVDGQHYRRLARADLAAAELEQLGDRGATVNRTWYVCMQKPFKKHPEFDGMLADVLRYDPNGVLVMHAAPSAEAQRAVRARFAAAGIDLMRVAFLDHLPHHRLLALYALADVVLDSYPASGCTTTREALELGARVVTLPDRYLGSRWSKAYYDMIGVGDLVARSRAHYVELAVRCGTDRKFGDDVKARILRGVEHLFYREEAVDNWADMLERLADGDDDGEYVPPGAWARATTVGTLDGESYLTGFDEDDFDDTPIHGSMELNLAEL